MILCVNANAAIDKTAIVSPFRLNEIHRAQQVLALPGGKGCNVARALKTLGETALVMGRVGGYAGQFIESGLHNEGIETAFVHTEAESRTCLSILDPEADTLTEVYERGEPIPAEKVAELVGLFRAALAVGNIDAVTLSGSLPVGAPTDFYAQLIAIAHETGAPVYLDSSGAALKAGVEARPALIKPNKREFAELVGGDLTSIDDYVTAARAISQQYDTEVVVSLGGEGAIAVCGGKLIHAIPPPVKIVSAVGSGDCLLAGMILTMVRGGANAERLCCGVAAGTANALRLGAGVFTRDDFDRIYAEVTITD